MKNKETTNPRFAAFLVACALCMATPTALSQAVDEEPEHPTEPPRYPHIFIADADGSNVSWVIEGRGPSWSPDGRQIAFYREGAEFRRGDMFVRNVDDTLGGRGYWLGDGIEPAWSPHGAWIAYTSSAGIAVQDAGPVTGELTLVRHDFLAAQAPAQGGTYAPWDMGVGKPSWSPDSLQIAFEHLGDGDMAPPQVFVMSADRDVQRLSVAPHERSSESDPAWSPDGSRIAMWSYVHGLASVSVEDHTARTVYMNFPAVAYGASPAWSPDGTRIAFVARDLVNGEPSIWVVDSTGGMPSELIPNAYDPAWSPDGNSIAFVSDLSEPTPLPDFPPVTGAASVYNWQRVHTDLRDASSRYLLFDDGTFELQYAWLDGDFRSYRGAYSRTRSEIEINFHPMTGWQAIGAFSDDEVTLSVVYNIEASLSDFEDGIYVLAGRQSPEGPVKEPDEPQDPAPTPEPGCGPRCSAMDEWVGMRRQSKP